MATENFEMIIQRLDNVKDIRDKTAELEKVKQKLKKEFTSFATEQKALKEYKSELELLMQEKMAHVEELRLIHADINLMENMVKSAEEERERAMNSAKHLLEDFHTTKQRVDHMRASLGLSCLPDLEEEDLPSPENLAKKPKLEWKLEDMVRPPAARDGGSEGVLGAASEAPRQLQLTQPSSSRGSLSPLAMSRQAGLPSSSGAPPGPPPVAGPPPGLQHGPPPAGPFRQQPPPMKSCMSCHQQIHRNAPICPLCKAKSRSRNPKKPKKKHDD